MNTRRLVYYSFWSWSERQTNFSITQCLSLVCVPYSDELIMLYRSLLNCAFIQIRDSMHFGSAKTALLSSLLTNYHILFEVIIANINCLSAYANPTIRIIHTHCPDTRDVALQILSYQIPVGYLNICLRSKHNYQANLVFFQTLML
jgi:hypothetical protein